MVIIINRGSRVVKSNRTLPFTLLINGVLGAESDVLDTMLGGGGTIDMALISAFALTSYGGEKSSLLSVPFTFVNRDHFYSMLCCGDEDTYG